MMDVDVDTSYMHDQSLTLSSSFHAARPRSHRPSHRRTTATGPTLMYANSFAPPPHTSFKYNALQSPASSVSVRSSKRTSQTNDHKQARPNHRQPNKPYGDRPERGGRPNHPNAPPAQSSSSLAARMGQPKPKPVNPRRLPAGTPPLQRGDHDQRMKDKKSSQTKLSEMLRGDGMKQWIRSRLIEAGVVNMSVSVLHLLFV
jgi:hypothetical protein